MEGDGPERRCAACNRQVVDLSSPPGAAEVARLVSIGASPCVRAVVRPRGLAAGRALSAVAALLASCSVERVQDTTPPPPTVAGPPAVAADGELDLVEWIGYVDVPPPPGEAGDETRSYCPPGWEIVLPDGSCASVVRPPGVPE